MINKQIKYIKNQPQNHTNIFTLQNNQNKENTSIANNSQKTTPRTPISPDSSNNNNFKVNKIFFNYDSSQNLNNQNNYNNSQRKSSSPDIRHKTNEKQDSEIPEELDMQKSEELIMQLNNSQVNMRGKTPPLNLPRNQFIKTQKKPESPLKTKKQIEIQSKDTEKYQNNYQLQIQSQDISTTQTILSTNTTSNNTKYSEKSSTNHTQDELWNTQELPQMQNNNNIQQKYDSHFKILEEGEESILTSENLAELSRKNSLINSPKQTKKPSKTFNSNIIQDKDEKKQVIIKQQNINNNSNNNFKKQYPKEIKNLIQSYDNITLLLSYFNNAKIQLSTVLDTYMSNINQQQLDKLDQQFQKNDSETLKIKKPIKISIILERLLIAIIIVTYLESKYWEQNITTIKNIIKYLQQNLLIIIDYFYQKNLKQIQQDTEITQKINNLFSQNIQTQNLQKNRKNNFSVLKQNNEMTLNLMKQASKNDKEFYSFLVNYIKNSDKMNIRECYILQFEYLAIYLTNYENINGYIGLPFLTVVPEPFLPPYTPNTKKPKNNNNNFSLILDLDETLIHYQQFTGNKGGQLQIRPYAQSFLNEMSQYYEVIIFTAAMEDYATWVIDNLDKNQAVEKRLFRQHTVRNEVCLIKDLSKIGRDLSKCIIVDNVAENFAEQPENGIFIKSWYSDPNDTALQDLGPLLKQIAQKNVPDVREALRQLKQQMVENINKNMEQPHLNLNLN